MPVDVSIRFRAESGAAKREINQLQEEIKELRQQLGSTQKSADTAGAEVKQLGDQSRQTAQSVDTLAEEAQAAAIGVTSLGRNIFKTSAEARKFGGVFADVTGRLHEANGQYAQTRERIDRLGDEARESASEVQKLGNALENTGRGTSGFSRGVGGAGRSARVAGKAIGLLGSVARDTLTTFGAYAAVDISHVIGRVGIQSVQAAGQLEQLTRATTQIEGSAEAAAQRMIDLREIADLPGLNFEPLTRYSNRLRAAGVSAADTNTILLTVGQTILSLGGTADKAALAMEQIIQAIQLGKVDFRDFRTIVQQIPGFLEALGDVHGVEASIEGLHDAFEKVGGSIIDILIPTFEELERRFESPPLDSYIVRIDALQNAFFHTQAAIGDLFLPTITEGARVLTEFLEAIRIGTKDLTTLPEPIQEIIAGAQHLYESLKRVGEGILRGLGPSVNELVKHLGGLLGQFLELVGVLLTALEPALRFTAHVLGVITAAAAQLVDHLGALIGGLADAVEWLAFWVDEGDKAKTATENLAAAQNDLRTAAEAATQAVEGATQALGSNASAGDQARAKLKILTSQLETTSSTIERYEERLKRAQAAQNTSDIEFYTRGLKTQRERAAALTAEISKLGETYGDAGANLGENATALEQQEARLKDLRTELQSANEEYERLDGLLNKAKDTYTSEASPAVEQYQRRVTAAKQAVSEIQVEIEKTESQVTKLKSATEGATDATDENTGTVEQAKVEYIEYSAILERAQREIQAFEKAFTDLNEAGRGFDDFWRIASGQVDNYSESIRTTVPSVVNLTEAEASLTAAIDANLALINPSIKGLESYGEQAAAIGGSLENLQRRTDAHNAALVNPAISEAVSSFRRYADVLGSLPDVGGRSLVTLEGVNERIVEFARETLTAEGVIGNFANRLGETENTYISLESVSNRLTGTIRDQSSAFDTLRGSVGGVSEASEKLSGELLDINDGLGDLDHSVQAVSGELDLVTGVFDTLSDRTEIFQDLAVTAFDELSRSVRSAGNEIDTVGESILAVSDLAARVATGDISALIQVPFRIADINAQQDAIHQQNQLAIETAGIDRRTQVGVADQNLALLARALGIPIGRFDVSQAPHSLQGLERINDFTGTPLEDLSRNLLSGRSDIAGGIAASIERAIENSNLDEDVARSIATLAVNLDRVITSADIEPIFKEFVDNFEGDISSVSRLLADLGLPHLIENLFGNIQREINAAALAAAPLASSNRYNLLQQIRAGRPAFGATLDAPTDDQERGVVADTGGVAASIEQPETLENVIASINADIGLINASITSIETQIGQASEPDEIATLLDRIPELIATKYQRLRDELDARYNAGTIGVDVYNASLSELESSEARDIEAHSDAVLANTVRAINEDVQRIDASITAIETQISQTSEPDEIIGLLSQIPGRITEKYQKLRDALDARYTAGEISVDVYNASLTALGSRQAADIERQSDAVLAQTIGEIDDNVQRIDANIGALQLAVEQSDDPAVIAGVLEAIKALVMDKYKQLRERLDALYVAEEISTTAYNAALTALGTGETRALANIDTQAFQEISEKAQAQVNLINSSIDNLRLSLELTDDPEAIQGILEAIKVLTANRFDVLIQELKDIEESLDPEQFDRALEGLQLGKQVALQNIDTELLNAVSEEARRQVDLINGSIGNLRLALQLTDEPAEMEQILNSIKILTAARFGILIQELKDIEASLDPEEFKIALDGLELGKQVALQNIDQEIADAFPPPEPVRIPPFQPPAIDVDPFKEISEAAQKQADFINDEIEILRQTLALTDDPAEIQQILDAIKTLTAARFDVLIQELHDIRESLSDEQYAQSLEGLELGKRLALENIDTEKFSAISAEADKQVNFINTDIENLRLSLELTDNPTERQQILDAIKVLTVQRFKVLRDELHAIRESLDPEVFDQALRGIDLGEQLALTNIDTEKFTEISAEADKQVSRINGTIENLRLSLQLTDDPAEIQQILDAIKVLTVARFGVLRDELIAIKDSLDPEVYEQALTGLNLAEQLAIENLDTEQFDAISAAAQKQVDFINGSIGNLRLALQLTDDPAEIQAILNSIKILTAKRFDVLIQGLKDIEDSFDDPAVFRQALEGLELGKAVALRGIDTESIGVTLTGIGEQISDTDSEITQLFDELGEQTTVAGVREAIGRLRAAITTKYQLMRDNINASAEKEEEKARQIAAVNISEGRELEQLGERGLGQFNSLVDTAQFLLDNATEAEFGTRRQDLINAINDFYDERIAFINGLDLSDTDRANMLEVARIQRNIALEAIPEMHASVAERLRLEQELHNDIEDLEAQRERNAEDRDQRLQDLAKDHQDRLTEIEERGLRDREDLQRDFNRSIEDIFRDAGVGEEFFLSGDFQDILKLSQIPGQQALQERLDALGIDLSDDDLERIRDRAVSRLRAQENVGIRQQRAEADAVARADEQRQNALAQAEVIAAAIRTELAPLLQPELAIETPLNTETGTALEAQAGVDRDTALGGDIDQTEIESIDAINAQAIGDRLETDAAITETRDQYIRARDTEIFKHNTAILQVNTAEAADIKAVRETLSKNLESIDETLDLELAEIREQTIVFDTRMNELITAINEQANQDVSSLKEDTAAMRSSLEAIAAEAKDNQWKSALLKIASTGITIAGVAAGATVGTPVAGLAVGQPADGVVEAAGNELFHYERTDRIARNIARQSAFRNSRPVPNYLPDANQIRNARDVSREIVSGISEGLQQRERGSFGGASEQGSLPEEITATLVMQWPDGATIELRDQILRLEQQDR